jgi:hypothetical protein
VLGIWTTDMASLIEENIREHYEGRTVEWQQRMRGTLQTDIPALNDTFCGQLMPFPEDSGGGADNDSHDGLPFGHENEMQEEASQGDRAGAANSIVVGDVWTPLAISGSSISSRENKTSEDHIAEPLASQINTSGLSSESRTLGRSFHRPSSYILRCRKREDRNLEDASEQRGAKRLLSDKNGSSLKDEAPDNRGLTCALHLLLTVTTMMRSSLGPGAQIRGVATAIAAMTTIKKTRSTCGP